MTTKTKITIATLLALFIVLALPVVASAQIDGLPSEPDAPIDGGLSLLVAAGVGYGAKKNKRHAEEKVKGCFWL